MLVVFSLTVSIVIPRRNPDFRARRLGVFFAVAATLVAGMLLAVEFTGGEEEAEAREGGRPAETAAAPTGAAGQEAAPPQAGGAPAGNPEAGAQVFASAGCGGCHTLAAAGATGTVGPNLDEVKPSYDTVVQFVTNGAPPMPAFGQQGILSQQQIEDVAAYVVQATAG